MPYHGCVCAATGAARWLSAPYGGVWSAGVVCCCCITDVAVVPTGVYCPATGACTEEFCILKCFGRVRGVFPYPKCEWPERAQEECVLTEV